MLSKKKKLASLRFEPPTSQITHKTPNTVYLPTRSDDTTSSKKKLARRGFGRHVIQSLPTHFPFIESCSSCCLKVCAQ